MVAIKTYTRVDHHLGSVSFRISRMEDIHEQRQGETDDPHRHDYFTVLLVKKAGGLHLIDFNEYPLAPLQLFFISPGQVHQVIEEEKSFGYAILFSTQFLLENHIPVQLIEDLNLFNDHGHTPPLPLDASEYAVLSSYCEEMIRLKDSDDKFRGPAIGSWLKLFLIRSNNLCTLEADNTQLQEAGNTILRRFRELVDQHYSRQHQTRFYADELNVTADHLNRVIKSLTGKTSKEYIQSRITVDAKRLLYFTGLSAKEIGYQLGFSEPANFSAFFKNCTGKSPTEFRRSLQK